MPDIFTKEKRSKIMSGIRSKGSKIEVKMMKALEESDLESEYQPRIFGKPDFLICPNIVVFCDSSFWHGRNWKKIKRRLREGYWQEHIEKNRERDKIVNIGLKKAGYVVLRFWDTQIEKDIGSCIKKIKDEISNSHTA
jgi:DNA mismatch endonuclease (patch repair protein)